MAKKNIYDCVYDDLQYAMYEQVLVLDVSPYGWVYRAEDENRCIVYVNPTLKQPYKLFTLCHELGHWFTSFKIFTFGDKAATMLMVRRQKSANEDEANVFAKSLLWRILNRRGLAKEFDSFYAEVLRAHGHKFLDSRGWRPSGGENG